MDPTLMSDEDYEEYVADFLSPRPVERIGIVLFIIICIVGVGGNVLVISVVLSAKRMRTSMNVLLTNLAVADLVILVICLPTTVIVDVTKTFWFSEEACKAILFVQNTGVYVSVLSLTYISYERWRAVTNPLEVSLASKKIVIPVIWTLSIILSTPEPFTLQIVPATFERSNFTTTWGTQCRASWSSDFEQTYQLVQSLVFYILPLAIISFLCHRTVKTLNSPQLELGRRQIGSRKRAVRMLAVVVFVFALSYLPVHAHNLSVAFAPTTEDNVEEENIDISAIRKLLARLFSYSSSSLNPILYNFLCRKFRKEYARLVLCRSKESIERTGTAKA